MKILVTGATGTVARGLIPALLGGGNLVRAMVHSLGNAPAWSGAEVVVGDFSDSGSLDQAFSGIDAALLVTPPHAQAAEWASAAISAATRAGVSRLVRISAIGAAVDGPNDNSRQHAHTDAEIRESGLRYVVLRPHFFMNNCLFGAEASIASDGTVRYALGHARVGMIDPRDISDCAARALIDTSWDGGTYDLTGPASISGDDVARTFSEALECSVRYVPITPGAAADFVRRLGGNEWQAEATRGYFAAYAAGWGDFTTDWVKQISGHPPRTFKQFIRDAGLKSPSTQNIAAQGR